MKKTALISGGFGDIGKATAKKFALNGYNLSLTYLSTIDTAFIEELKSLGAEVLATRCDQTNASDIINFVANTIHEFGSIDSCVLCSGKAENERFLFEKSIEEIDEIISVNFRGNILFAREVLRVFNEQKYGNLVFVSSIYGNYGGSMESVYSACKAGLNGLVKSLAVEVAPLIRVNAVAPGFIDTKMTKNVSDQNRQYCVNQIPLSRLGTPDDVAKAIYFLSSDESSYITGEIIDVSGGAMRF